MKITIACGSMPFGPDTIKVKSLGGSETAALMLAKELAKRGHSVNVFCNMPAQGEPDYWPSGKKHADGIVYIDLNSFVHLSQASWTDLAIIVRDPNLACQYINAGKKVLWAHDIFTKRGMARALDQMSWTFDEIWCVSEWHRKQIHDTTGYPLEFIKAIRNGIVPIETIPFPRMTKQLVYAARPERGLENLIKPGGVMEHLPEYNLKVAFYAHFPEHMRDYYAAIFQRMKEMPNVEFIGPQSQQELRQLIGTSAAYIYPTQFEETSCILARECIEQRTPFLTTKVGALPETLGDCGVYLEDWINAQYDIVGMAGPGDALWCQQFARFVRDSLFMAATDDTDARPSRIKQAVAAMHKRTDLYWDAVAADVEKLAEPTPVTPFSRAWSLMQDGDVIAARAFVNEYFAGLSPVEDAAPAMCALREEIETQYPFLLPVSDPRHKSMAEYYEWVYTHKKERDDSELTFIDNVESDRVKAITEELARLPAGARVFEYGCGPGHLLASLAKRLPHLQFVGCDISPAAIHVLNNGAMAGGYSNLRGFAAMLGDGENGVEGDERIAHELSGPVDAAIISEVLEHVVEPWEVADKVSGYVKEGGRILITCPYGPWEVGTIRQPGKWHERAHIWHLDGMALREIFGHMPNFRMQALPRGLTKDARQIGNSLAAYDNPPTERPRSLDPLSKALQHHPRQSVIACVIAYNNEHTITRMLESIQYEVQWVNVAIGPSTDRTRALCEEWFAAHPWIGVTFIDVPKIEPWKFGFDHARQKSTQGYEAFDWFLWIDTDEYLSGSFSKYLRNSMLTGYIISQHHFSVEPRGAAPQIDRPARLLRTNAGYAVRGHIHEHFEKVEDGKGGVGRCFMLPDVDIGHVGYVNEEVRRDRFNRNYEFLKWDHEDGKDRELHHFLWFRDIVHFVRLHRAEGNMPKAIELAKEGLRYYNDNWNGMTSFGHGMQMGTAYVSELLQFLGKGVPLKLMLQLEDRAAPIEGVFENYEQLDKLLRFVLEPEFKDRTGKYW